MEFGDALRLLKGGYKVARSGWNGKGMWLSLSGPLGPRQIPASAFWSTNNADYARSLGGAATVLPCITMKTATGEILMGWLASQTDMLADDWELVTDKAASEALPPEPPVAPAPGPETLPCDPWAGFRREDDLRMSALRFAVDHYHSEATGPRTASAFDVVRTARTFHDFLTGKEPDAAGK